VYLAQATGDVHDEWLKLRRELSTRGYEILPQRRLDSRRRDQGWFRRTPAARDAEHAHPLGRIFYAGTERGRSTISIEGRLLGLREPARTTE
jgi:hypothetical protein